MTHVAQVSDAAPHISFLNGPSETDLAIPSALEVEARATSWLLIAIWSSTVVLSSVIFHYFYYPMPSLSLQSTLFSALLLPLLALFIRVLILAFINRAVYSVLAAADWLFKIVLAAYIGYFGEGFSISVIRSNWPEGVSVFRYSLSQLPFRLIAVAALLLLVEILTAARISRSTARRLGKIGGWFVVSLWAFGAWHVPPRLVREPWAYANCTKIMGYYTAMVAELFYASGEETNPVRVAVEMERRYPTKTLRTNCQLGLTIDRVIAIQVESLDYNVVGHKVGRQLVVPFLNSLLDRSVFLKLCPNHAASSGSSGADLQVLTGMLPFPRTSAYRIYSVDYRNSIPAIMRRNAFTSEAFHGNEGAFFGRAYPFKEMGFNSFYDLSHFRVHDAKWGVSDRVLFDEAGVRISAARSPSFFFIITLSSHGPFDWVYRNIFGDATEVERYFNAINYVDRALAVFLARLPGRSLVVIYGDHCAMVSDGTYTSRSDSHEYVPGFVTLVRNGNYSRPEILQMDAAERSGDLDLRSLYKLIAATATAQDGHRMQTFSSRTTR